MKSILGRRSSSADLGRGLDATGKLVMESILETKAATILQFFAGLRGSLSVTFEEGTCAAWLYDLHRGPQRPSAEAVFGAPG